MPAGQFVAELAGVFFEMRANDSDALGWTGGGWDVQFAIEAQRQVVLADLVALGQVRIEVIFSVKDAVHCDLAIEGKRRLNDHLNCHSIGNWHCSGQAQTYRTRSGVRFSAKSNLATTEHF